LSNTEKDLSVGNTMGRDAGIKILTEFVNVTLCYV